MRLCELGEQYALTAQGLRDRIRQVEAEEERERDEGKKLLLSYRLRLLRSMWRDTRAVANHLEHYYERGVSRNENYVI